ncbi:ARM repeat-containing protein [Pholiota conissans]|uniref:ARM repeat-containing protein n=1 Tax=Pholiota conissans TaxID=109636 RepID=A0A9P5Z9Q9_9AGAR|nr:ARM repeat-containing protein [Pholiota conissans]
MTNAKVVSALVGTLIDKDKDVQAAAFSAVLSFSERTLYQSEIISCIPKIIRQTEDQQSLLTRQHAIQILGQLARIEAFQASLNPLRSGEISSKLFSRFDDDYRVQSAAVDTFLALSASEDFRQTVDIKLVADKLVATLGNDALDISVFTRVALGARDMYQYDVAKPLVSGIISKMDSSSWLTRYNIVQKSNALLEQDEFRRRTYLDGLIPKLAEMLKDKDTNVLDATVAALETSIHIEFYKIDLIKSVPTIIDQLHHENWSNRLKAVHMLVTLSRMDEFRGLVKDSEIIDRLIELLDDHDGDVLEATVAALLNFAQQGYFLGALQTLSTASIFVTKLTDRNAVPNRSTLAELVMLTMTPRDNDESNLKSLVHQSIPDIVKQLDQTGGFNWYARQQATKILTKFATNVEFQKTIISEKTIPKLAAMLMDDDDDDVRTAVAEAFLAFASQELFREAFTSEKIVNKLAVKLVSESNTYTRDTVQSAISILSGQGCYQDDIQSIIPTLVKQLEDKNEDIWKRQQIIQLLVKLSKHEILHTVLKGQSLIPKIITKLDDHNETMLITAAEAISELCDLDKAPFKDDMEEEKVVAKLVTKLVDNDSVLRSPVHDALLALGKQEKDISTFLEPLLLTLAHYTGKNSKACRTEVYKLLNDLKGSYAAPAMKGSHSAKIVSNPGEGFLDGIDQVVCNLIDKMDKNGRLPFIHHGITILSDLADQGLRGETFKPSNDQGNNKAAERAKDMMENILRNLTYDKASPDLKEIVAAFLQLAKNDIFSSRMGPVIYGLIDGVSSNDQEISSVATAAISALARQDKFRTALVPTIEKLTQKLNGWLEEEEFKFLPGLIQPMSDLIQYKEFRNKFRKLVILLMSKLGQIEPYASGVDEDKNNTKINFYKAACKFTTDFVGKNPAAGRDLVPHLTRILSNMDGSLATELFELVKNLVENGSLNLTDKIALTSALRIVSPTPAHFDVWLCKLKMAKLLLPTDISDKDYAFLRTVLGNYSDFPDN